MTRSIQKNLYFKHVQSYTVCGILMVLATIISQQNLYALETQWTKTNIESTRAHTIEHSPQGIWAGEFDTYIQRTPYNGVYFSPDFGETWREEGLATRGVTSLDFYEDTLYAATYYSVENMGGLFSKNLAENEWVNLSPNMSLNSIKATETTLYIGSYSNGLWISTDGGINWTQKVGSGWYGPQIWVLAADNTTAIAATTSTTYITQDSGQTWEILDFLDGTTTKAACVKNNDILIGTSYPHGLYLSNDLGDTWTAPEHFTDTEITSIAQMRDTYYIGLRVPETSSHEMHYGKGNNWTKLGNSFPDKVVDITWLLTQPPMLFASSSNQGVYKIQIEPPTPENNAFLDIPWNYATQSELVDKITAFFDHQYPLLGYPYYSEPTEDETTTLNYLGIREKAPEMYYSSHNGVDFALAYGTPIMAPAPGEATYYYCTDCGHTIKLNHENGYQTTYMHLQNEGLVTATNTSVETGDTLGYVGMTGRTTGPHLHFSTKKLSESNGYGVTDPFGWQAEDVADPWQKLVWTDALGEHEGTSSEYLWNSEVPENKETIVDTQSSTVMDNKSVELNEAYPLNISLRNHKRPYLPYSQNNLIYLDNTSLLVRATNLLGGLISELNWPAEIRINFDSDSLENVISSTIKLYYWDENELLWKSLPTVLDLIDGVATARTDHFSWFALLGESVEKFADCTVRGARFSISTEL